MNEEYIKRMIIVNKCVVGVPKERKVNEGRVGMTPVAVKKIIEVGGTVLIETGAGLQSGFNDEEYKLAGARIVEQKDAWGADLVVKVKEPIKEEYQFLAQMDGKTLFTYLHLAGTEIELTRELLRNNITAIAYETVSDIASDGRVTFPLLTPMSKIAGKQAMRTALLRHAVEKWKKLAIFIIGGGNVGEAALVTALANGVDHAVVFEAHCPRLDELRRKYKDKRVDVFSMEMLKEPMVRLLIPMVDIFICGPMLPGGKEAPIVLTQREFRTMKQNAYISDVSIDQGGSTEWTRGKPTKPGETFTRGARGLVFSAVPNIPGSTVPREATLALCKATLPYIAWLTKSILAQHNGAYVALRDNESLRRGLQTHKGWLTNVHVSSKHGLFRDYYPLSALF